LPIDKLLRTWYNAKTGADNRRRREQKEKLPRLLVGANQCIVFFPIVGSLSILSANFFYHLGVAKDVTMFLILKVCCFHKRHLLSFSIIIIHHGQSVVKPLPLFFLFFLKAILTLLLI
jgi:hypothetical protein